MKFIFFVKKMHLSENEINKLQDLAAVHLSEGKSEKFFDKLGSIIEFLGRLKDLDLFDVILDENIGHLLTPIPGVKNPHDQDLLLGNVKHEVINNSVVVKSVLG